MYVVCIRNHIIFATLSTIRDPPTFRSSPPAITETYSCEGGSGTPNIACLFVHMVTLGVDMITEHIQLGGREWYTCLFVHMVTLGVDMITEHIHL